MKISLLGPPGSGKTCQAEMLAKIYHLKYIGLGNLLRQESKKKTLFGKKIRTIINKGNLVPDKIVIKLLKNSLKLTKNNFLLDGFPRDIEEAKALDKLTKIDYLFNITASTNIIIKRLTSRRVCSCGESYNLLTKKPKKDLTCDICRKKLYQREDDKKEIIKKRLNIYNKKTKLVINYYKNKNILFNINGDKDIKTVLNQIKKIIKW